MNLKLRTRITLFVLIILIACVGCLTFFSVANSQRLFGGIVVADSALIVQQNVDFPEELTGDDDSIAFNIAQEHQIMVEQYDIYTEPMGGVTTPDLNAFPEYDENVAFTVSIMKAQQGFQFWQIGAMFLVIIIGAIGTNFFMKRALKPLTQLSSTIEQIDGGRMDVVFSDTLADDEVGSLTKSFQSMMGRIQDAFDVQKNFAESAAHELKTPLATMKGSLQVLLMDTNPTQEDFEESMNLQISQIDRLTGIVDQLLQITDASAALDQQVDLEEVVLKSIEKAYDLIGNKEIKITYEIEECVIQSNPVLIACITDNILNNAVKYSEQGTIQVRLEKTPKEITFSVTDEGMGISEKDMERVFNAFYRSDEVKIKQVSGNGLGLRIVKAAVEKLGGDIAVESTPGSGSWFEVKLPVAL